MTKYGPENCLQDALMTFAERNQKYGNAYTRFGTIMAALFPDGLMLKTVLDWNRYACIHMIIAKMARYTHNFEEGHLDSAHDPMVYSAMLESLDREHADELKAQPFKQDSKTSEVSARQELSVLACPVSAPMPAPGRNALEKENKELKSRLDAIRTLIWFDGAPTGSANHFKIRNLASTEMSVEEAHHHLIGADHE